MPLVAIIGCANTHGGTFPSGSSDFTSQGTAILRVGDPFNCPIHGINSIASSPISNFSNDGKIVATVGSITECGSVITNSSSNWDAS